MTDEKLQQNFENKGINRWMHDNVNVFNATELYP